MKFRLTIMVCCIAVSAVQAQVHIQTVIPTVGLIQRNQLWNLVMINASRTIIEGRIDMVLRDRTSGLEILTATSNRINLTRGSSTYNVNSLSPIQYNYLAIAPSTSLNGLLPAGNYLACYNFLRIHGEVQESIVEECVPFDVEPLSPPKLIFPSDSSVLDISPTQFTWNPPTPATMFSRLRYEFIVTEVQPGQQAEEAIQSNTSFYSNSSVDYNFTSYPGSLPSFEKEKWYSWQVIARDDQQYAGKSDVHVFKVTQAQPVHPMVSGTPFVKMKTNNPDKSIAPNGFLKLAYYNENSDSTARVFIQELSGGAKSADVYFDVVLRAGDNYIQYNLKKLLGDADETKIYQAMIVSSKGERSYMRFTVKYFN